MASLPPWARPSHTLTTPRLVLRSALPSDALAFTHLTSHALNNPFGGVVGATRTESEQRASLAKQSASTARGENAWLVVILNPDGGETLPESAESLRVHDGVIIGSTGFNAFTIEKEARGEEVLIADIGALIDWRFQRKGYALETLEKVVNYGFEELGVEKFTLETNALNRPFRSLMEQLGIAVERITEAGRPDNEGDTASYRFGKNEWEVSKEKLNKSGKWYI